MSKTSIILIISAVAVALIVGIYFATKPEQDTAERQTAGLGLEGKDLAKLLVMG